MTNSSTRSNSHWAFLVIVLTIFFAMLYGSILINRNELKGGSSYLHDDHETMIKRAVEERAQILEEAREINMKFDSILNLLTNRTQGVVTYEIAR